MIKGNYKYDVNVVEMKPLPTGEKFAGKVTLLYDVRTCQDVKATFPETWGLTPEDAKMKMTERVQRWIDQQPTTA